MNNLIRITLPTLALLTVASVATAQAYADLDTDADGLLSFPELQAAAPDLTEDDFAGIDTSGDGLLDGSEVSAAVDAGLLPAAE